MYVILICFLILFVISFAFSKFFLDYFDKKNYSNYSVFDAFFIGLSLLGVFLNLWSVFFPTNTISLVAVSFFACLFILKKKKEFKLLFTNILSKLKKEKVFLLLLFGVLILSLFYSLPTPKLYDSYLYHINAIQWNEYFKATPGLANFHDRLGFNSTVFVLGACFSFHDIYNQYIFVINALAFFIFISWLLKKIIDNKDFRSIILIVFIYYFLNQYYNDISSPGSDILTNIILSYLFLNLVFDSSFLKTKKVVFIVLPLFCITLKLSTLPIILITALAIFYKSELKQGIKTLFFYSFIFFVPWMLRNIILSGYILYPVESIDLFSFDWKVPINRVIETKKWIYSWARIPFKDYKEVLNMPFLEWFSIWWNNQLLVNKNIFSIALISPLFFLINHFYFKMKYNFIHLVVLLTAYVNMMIWIFTAPDFRFLFSVILLLALFPLFTVKFEFKELYLRYFFTSIILLFFGNEIKNSYLFFKKDYKNDSLLSYIYLPKDVSEVKINKQINFKDVFLNNKLHVKEPIPSHTQCFDVFPCSWYIDGNLKLRGDKIEEGFMFNEK